MNLTLDLWCARNLGILAILGLLGICMVCGPLLLLVIVSGPFYALTNIRYMPWLQAASWITAFTICVSLFLYGIFLLIQYFRYPKIGFGLSKRFFGRAVCCSVQHGSFPWFSR
jgi:hypothetical protein